MRTMLAVFVPVGVLAIAFTPGDRAAVALGLTAAFAAVIGVTAAVFRYRPEWTVGGPVRNLDPDDRRRVAHAVRSGEATDARLAPAVAYSSRWMMGLSAFMLVDSVVMVADRLASFGGAADLIAVVTWSVAGAFFAVTLVRARRALEASRPLGPAHPAS